MLERNGLSIITEQKSTITMSSVEIAKICNKRHDHVMRDIRNMFAELNLDAPQFWGTYKTAQGNEYQCFFLPKREVMILVSGYRIDLRAKIIDRLNELESQQSPKIPQTLPEALRLAADLAEQNQVLQLESKQKSEQIDSMVSYFRSGMTAPQFAKGLNGVNSSQINAHLHQVKWLYKDSNGDWRVSSYARDRYMTEETSEVTAHGKDPFIKYKPTLLKKGAAKIYEWYVQGKLTMKSNWNGEFTQDKVVGL